MNASPPRRLILIVDDESDIRDILGDALVDEGYRVACAADGQEALELVAAEVPDLIVSDIKMPRVHGLTLIERVRELGHTMPVVLISTWTPPDRPGVQFVAKPFDLDDITAAIELSLGDA